ncbi:hypothetical protein NPIL_645801, partial [Nephila pilipes]
TVILQLFLWVIATHCIALRATTTNQTKPETIIYHPPVKPLKSEPTQSMPTSSHQKTSIEEKRFNDHVNTPSRQPSGRLCSRGKKRRSLPDFLPPSRPGNSLIWPRPSLKGIERG